MSFRAAALDVIKQLKFAWQIEAPGILRRKPPLESHAIPSVPDIAHPATSSDIRGTARRVQSHIGIRHTGHCLRPDDLNAA